ncbi:MULTISPECIES: YdcF family protein [unclassified Caballeronia]|uniref:YdcF family protein n=1 Tax=unclassified Caballeronia TaxID=2646786 RepID=UPI0020299E71|nr:MULTISPECIES: YdcF family protein [unclassified Caballeronia]
MILRAPGRPAWLIAAAAALAGVWLIGSGVWGAAFRDPGDEPAVSQGEHVAIVLLSAGARRERPGGAWVPTRDAFYRIEKTADVYRACKHDERTCAVIVSGGDPDGHGISDAQLYQPWLVGSGVDPRDITLETQSANTRQNARYVSRILHGMPHDSVTLVTSAYHMRRAQLNFEGLGIRTHAAAAFSDSATVSLVPRRKNFLVAYHVVHETLGIAQYWVIHWIGVF